MGCSPWGRKESDTTKQLVHFAGSSALNSKPTFQSWEDGLVHIYLLFLSLLSFPHHLDLVVSFRLMRCRRLPFPPLPRPLTEEKGSTLHKMRAKPLELTPLLFSVSPDGGGGVPPTEEASSFPVGAPSEHAFSLLFPCDVHPRLPVPSQVDKGHREKLQN